MNPQFILRGTFILICFLYAHSICTAQESGSLKLNKAIAYYKAANYDRAIELLAELADDNTFSKRDKKEIMLLLGRAYVAKDLMDKAKASVKQLLDLEPPPIELDPDMECPPLMRIYYDVRKNKEGSTSLERADPGIKTIAILDFKNRSIDDKEKFDPMEKGFADLLINHLNGAINLKVVERERIQWILDEIGLENDPGKFDMTSAVRVGKQLGVHTILLGSFIKIEDEMKLLARLVKVETSEILATDETEGSAEEFFELAEKLSLKIAKGINVKLAQVDVETRTETKSLDAVLSYSEGLASIEKGNYEEAYNKFLKALEYDPTYERARRKAESIKILLG